MSFAVVRGSPTAAQRFVDAALEGAARGGAGGGDPAHVSMPQLMLHCMREHPDDIFMVRNDCCSDKFCNKAGQRCAIEKARRKF